MQADKNVAPLSRSPDFSEPDACIPQIHDHTLLCLIGSGAYGEVWMARNALGALRAVKVVHRQSFHRADHFEREFKGLLKFEPVSRSHNGLVDILQIGRRDESGYFYYVMELADDFEAEKNSAPLDPANYRPHTLRAQLHARGALPPQDCINIGLKLSRALDHLHRNGLVHRDIKPSNIIFVNGEPKLADIGLVTAIDEAQSLVGTPGYIPPEGPGTPKADLYSLGKVLYEIAFGKDRQEFPQLPPDLQSHLDYLPLLELNEIILRACESDFRLRYRSAQEMQTDLSLLERGQSVKRQRLWQHRWILSKRLGLAAIAVLLVASTLYWRGYKHAPAANPEVMRLYDLGHWYHGQLNPEDLQKAVKFLNQALEIDPQFVPAYADLFEIYIWTFPGVALTRNEQWTKLRAIADKLLAIDPNLPEGHAALSYCKYLERDWRGAEEEIQRALRLNPNYSMGHSLYGYYLSLLGRTDEALREVRRGEELGSASSRMTVLVNWFPFMASRQLDKAVEQLQRVVELDRNFQLARSWLGRCYEAQGNYLAAIKEYEIADLASGEDVAETRQFYDAWRQSLALRGERGYWEKKLEDLKPETNLTEEERSSREIAGSYAKLEQKEKALEELETHFDQMTVWNSLKFDPLFDSLHDEPRFKALLKRAGLEP